MKVAWKRALAMAAVISITASAAGSHRQQLLLIMEIQMQKVKGKDRLMYLLL